MMINSLVRRHGGLILSIVALLTVPSQASIQHVAEGFLFSGTNFTVLISDTNGSIVSMSSGSGDIATSGEAGLWTVAFTTNTGGSTKTGDLNAVAFSTSSPSNLFSWTLSPASNQLYLTYSNADITVEVMASNRADGIDFSAALTPRTTNVYALTLPAPLRFDPEVINRFITPNHSSDGVGMAFNKTYFEVQNEDSPASWKDATVGPIGYTNLYGGPLTFGTNNSQVSLSFTPEGVTWLGASLSNKWAAATAIVNRPPAEGQADVVLIDSPEGAFLSGSQLGGGVGAGYLMRIGGPVPADEVQLSLDVVIGALEHLAQTSGGRSEVALLSLVRGPVVGATWPSEVRLDQWRARIEASGVLASNGISLVELSNMPEILSALTNTNVFAILNPYGELIPASLTEGVLGTVTNIGPFVQGGGHWFEVGGHPFFQVLQPDLYYTNSILYPPLFADFFQVETTNGHASIYGIQPLPPDPWAGATNAAALFVPGHLIWGGDAQGGWLQRSFGTYVAPHETWTSPSVRLSFGRSAEEALADYSLANNFNRGLADKMTVDTLGKFRQSVMIHFKGDATQMTARLDDLPAPALLHFEEYLYGGFDKAYPDHLPPNPTFGTPEEFTNFLGEARQRNMLTMPYTNPTFWGVDPKGPTFLATNDAPLLINLDGSLNFEEYFGEGGFTVTPWHPAVQAANRNTRNQFLTNYPIDVLFHDQIGARTWQYDINPESPAPYAYIAGVAAIAGEDSQLVPLSTENGWDKLVNHESQFAGLAWGLAPTTNAPFWRRYLRERYAPSTWEIYPVAQHLAHDKVGFIYNNLDAAVHNHEVIAWTLGLGYGMTEVLFVEELDVVPLREWLKWIDRVQKSVVARYVGEGIIAFDHHWGTNSVHPDNGVIAAQYGTVSTVGNLGPDTLITNGWTLPGYGYLATAPGMRAARHVPPGGGNPVPYVAETNSSGGLDFWIYSVGDTNVTLVLPPGFNGSATVQVDGDPAVQTQIVNDVLTVTLSSAATADEYLWHGTVAGQGGNTILIDFGRHDGGTNGDTTTSPDSNGNYWNNLGPTTQAVSNGTRLANLVTITNGATGMAIEMITAGWEANGILNGGLLTPSPTLLGDLAVTNATMDYFFTTASATLRISGLETNQTYDLTFFGTRETTTTRISTYTVGAASTNLQTSGPGIGDGGYDGNNDHTATLVDLAPNTSGEIDVTLSVDTGGFAYLGLLKIAGIPAGTPPPAGVTQGMYRVDFGRHDGGVNGTATTSPDTNGLYWNNLGPTGIDVALGTRIDNLIDTTNGSSAIDLEITTASWDCNGKLNGGLLSPSPSLLGNLAIATATEDYFFTQGSDRFKLEGLNPDRRYNLRFFGTRSNTSTRITTYATAFASTNLQTSGAGIGDSGYDGNNDTVVVLPSIAPTPSGEIEVTVSVDTGGFAYLGILEIEEYTPAPSTNPGPGILTSPGALSFVATNGAANPSAQTFGLTNNGVATLNFNLASNANWLTVSPVSGSLAPGAGQQITVTVDATGLPIGLQSGLILVSDPAATNDPQYVSVSLQVKPDGPLLAVFGSSVAKGWNSSGQFADPDVFVEGGSWSNGYTALMTLLLADQGGPAVTNASTPGDNTAAGLSKFDTYIKPLSPTYALLAFSLGNEGLAGSTDPTSSNIVATFSANLWNLVGLCRSNGIYPVISSVYPHGNYTTNNYAYLKQMHLTINAWDVPSLNLLTPVDDGAGQWMDGYWSDAAHPNDPGYVEFFYSFVPSLFDAIANGKTDSPAFGSATNYARLAYHAAVDAPLTFTPTNTMHSFTMAFRVRTTATGTIAAVQSGGNFSSLEVRSGQLVYVDRNGAEIVMTTNLADGVWHEVALSSRYALSNTAIYVDGTLAGSIPEQYVPDQFILGGPAGSGRAPTPSVIDLDNWCVYRAGWTVAEASAQANGNLQQSSMEIGAMLDDAVFVNGMAASNVAQSLSVPHVNTPNLLPWTPESSGAQKLMVYGSSVAKGYHGPGSPGYTNGSFALGYAGRLTPALEASGWLVTNASVGGNSTTDALARFDTDAIPVDPDIILIGLSMGNEGLATSPDSDGTFESFRSGMTNLIYRSRTNGFYPAVTLNYPNNLYDISDYGYIKRMNLLINTWDVPSVNLLGAIDDGTGQWADGYWTDSAHPNPTGYREMYAAFVPSLFDAIQLGKTGTPQIAGTTGFAHLSNAGSQPLTFTPDQTVLGYSAAFRVRSTFTGTVAAVLSSTGSAAVASPATFLVDFGRHDGGINGTATASPDAYGQYWNNLSPANPESNNAFLVGATIANLVTVSNAATTAGLELNSMGWYANGILNGGLLAPSNGLLGHLAVASATEDYLYVGGSATFKLTGLNPDSTYTLRFFGSRDSTETRVTIFAVGTNATPLTTSGTGIGTYAVNQNDNTIAQLSGLTPEANGDLEVLVIRSEGSYAHLNLLEVIEAPGTGAPRGGVIELRDGEVAYVAEGGGEITAPVDGISGGWIDIALSYSSVRNLTLFYVDGVPAGTIGEEQRPMQFVLGGPGALTNAPAAPANFDLQDWILYRAPWTPEEAMAQHTGAIQQASMEIGSPLNEATFSFGGIVTNLAQSLSAASIEGTNLTAGTPVTPPGNLVAVSPADNTVNLTWDDNSVTETGYVLQRRGADGAAFWSNLVSLAANATGYADTGVPGGIYQYRVASQEGILLSDHSNVALASVTNAPYSDPTLTYREWASGYFALAREGYWIDFNTNAGADYGGQSWNTVTGLSSTAAYSLTATNGGDAGYTLTVTDDFSDFRSGTGSPLPDFDADAQGTYFGINAAGAQVVLSNLNRNARYDALVFTRRGFAVSGFDYRTVFTFSGGGSDVSFEVDASSNTVPVRVFSLKPDGIRTLTLDIDGPASPTGTVFGGVNLLVLEEINGPGPYLIDFNTLASPVYPAGETWNTINHLSDPTPYSLADIDGETSAGYSLTLDDGFDQFRSANGDLIAGFPADAEQTCFALRDDVPLVAQMTFAGLDTNLLYDITFLARRGVVVGGFDYSGTYTFTGAVTTVVVADSATNTLYHVVQGLAPDAGGEISLTISAGPNAGTDFPVLNLLRLSQAGPAPGNLMAADPYADPDGDDMASIVEYGQDQDPTAAGPSTFEIMSGNLVPGSGSAEAFYRRNRWTTQVSYPVDTTTNLIAGTWGPAAGVTETMVDDDGTNQTIRLEWAPGAGDQFLRIRNEYTP